MDRKPFMLDPDDATPDLEGEDGRRPVKRRRKFPMRNPFMPVSTPGDAPPASPSYREMEMGMGMMDRDDEEEYEYEMDMMSVMPDDEEDGMPDQAFPPRRIKDQGGPGAMQGQMPMGAAPGKMMGGMQAPMQGMGQGMQMNPQMIAKMMQMMKKRKGGM